MTKQSSCAWSRRNVDPSMTLLNDVTALQSPAAGIVSVSSRSIRLYPATASRAGTEAIATAAPVDRELCSIELAGVPTAFQHLQGCKWALADTMAELWIIHLADAHRLCKITAGVPLTVAHFLCLAADLEADAGKDCIGCMSSIQRQSRMSEVFKPTALVRSCILLPYLVTVYHLLMQDQSPGNAYALTPSAPLALLVITGLYFCEQQAYVKLQACAVHHDCALADCPIQLFLGSRTDTSQLLSIPRALTQDQALPAGTQQDADAAEGCSKQVLEPDSVQRLPAFDCAAPIHDAFAFQDPPGEARAPCPHACHATCSRVRRSLFSCTVSLLTCISVAEGSSKGQFCFCHVQQTIIVGGNGYVGHQPTSPSSPPPHHTPIAHAIGKHLGLAVQRVALYCLTKPSQCSDEAMTGRRALHQR